MRPPQELSYLFDRTTPEAKILDALADRFTVEETEHSSGERYYYDTFDWRLFRKKIVMTISKNRLELTTFDGAATPPLPVDRHMHYFWWDIDDPGVRERLKGITDMRALSRLFCSHYAERRFRVLNKDRKTIARIILKSEKVHADGVEGDLLKRLYLYEIRGYDDVFNKIRNVCDGAGLKPMKGEQEILELTLSGSDRQPLDYGNKFRVDLHESMSVGQAVSKISLELVRAMQTNHGGVCSDIDSEFLHDFRIAVRRTRSLLSLLRKELPPGKITFFQSEFKWLGGVTGPVRDIDVYLLKREEYMALLPASLHPGLNLFFDELDRGRIKEAKLLRRQLASTRYHQLVEDWHRYLTAPDSELLSGGQGKKCRGLADTLIAKRFNTFLRDGHRISDASSDAELHRLRIKGKKLRYLLEFFRGFYNDDGMNRFLKQMKKLQDNLGDFNDLSVQQEMLGARLTQLKPGLKRTMQMGASLGGLITALTGEKKIVRSAFQKSFSSFSKGSNTALLEKMISDSSRRVP